MKINCTYKEMLDYVKNYGDSNQPGSLAMKLVNTWTFVRKIPELILRPQDFHVVIRTEPDVSGFTKLIFTFSKPINTPTRLAHYLKAFDDYMISNYSKSYVSLFRQDPDWWLLWCFLERALTYQGEQFQPIVITVKDDTFALQQPIPARNSCNIEIEHVWSA